MDIRQLTYFVEVLRRGSITAASEVLDVSQPAISVSLRKLETEIGAPLLDRSPAGVSATPAGDELLPRAEAILARVDEAIVAARSATSAGPHELRLAIPPIVGMQAILDILENFIPEHPEINVTILEAGTEGVLAGVEKGQIDIAVAIAEEPPQNSTLWTQVDVPIVAYVARDSELARKGRVDLAEFDGYPIALMGAGARISDVILAGIRAEGAEPKIIHRTVQLGTLFELASRNAAIAFSTENVSQLSRDVVPVHTNPELTEVVSIFAASHLSLDGVVRHVLNRITSRIEAL